MRDADSMDGTQEDCFATCKLKECLRTLLHKSECKSEEIVDNIRVVHEAIDLFCHCKRLSTEFIKHGEKDGNILLMSGISVDHDASHVKAAGMKVFLVNLHHQCDNG